MDGLIRRLDAFEVRLDGQLAENRAKESISAAKTEDTAALDELKKQLGLSELAHRLDKVEEECF